MATRVDLEAAAQAGVISTEQVQPLADFLANRVPAARAGTIPVTGEEDLRFIRNFHDVFLAIGIVLFAIGLAVGIGTYVATLSSNPLQATVTLGGMTAGGAVVIWLLGEFFARRRRLFLPAIAIVCSLTLYVFFAAAALYTGILLGRDWEGQLNFETMPPEVRTGILVAVGAAVLAPALFYLRFRLPFSLGLTGSMAALFVVVTGMVFNFEQTVQLLPAIMLVLGLLLFIAGVTFDARDPTRATRLSDNGFWLHFAAAPLILNGAFGLIGQLFSPGAVGPGSLSMIERAGEGAAAPQAAATLVIIVFLGFVSVLINRRALIVSALLTAGVAIAVLMNSAGLGAGALAAATLISLGGFVLILGAGWHSVRRGLLAWVKPDGLWARIFPPELPVAERVA